MLDSSTWKSEHSAGLTWQNYLAAHADRTAGWKAHIAAARLTAEQGVHLASFKRRMNVLVLTGAWCGDCAVQCPMIGAVAAACPVADVRFLEQADHADLADQLRICGGTRVPTVVWCSEDFHFCSILGDRTLARYRSIAARQLGASCPLPWATVATDEATATLQGWLEEFERVQLMLRTSPRLRQLHGD